MHARCCVEGNPSGTDTSILGTYQTNCVYAPSTQVRVSESPLRCVLCTTSCTRMHAGSRGSEARALAPVGPPTHLPRLASPRLASLQLARSWQMQCLTLRPHARPQAARAHAHTHTTSQPSHRRLHGQNLAPRTRPSSSLAQLLPFLSPRVGRVAKQAAPDSSSDRALLPWTTCARSFVRLVDDTWRRHTSVDHGCLQRRRRMVR